MQKSQIIKRASIVSCVFLFFNILFLHPSLYASQFVRVDKAKVRLSISPGQSVTGVLNLENPNPEPQFVQFYLEDWYYLPSQDGTKEFVPPNTTPLS